MSKYNHKKIEEKWQKYWQDNEMHKTDFNAKKPYYCLDMFPYPSGEGLHVGHWSGYVYSDVWSRYKRLQGYEVLHPMGWDAFGLPAENAAIKNDAHPRDYTKKAIKNFTRQLKEIGAMYDWSLEINSSSPDYYKWTQWLFLELYKNDLAYQKEAPVNYCPSCQTVLANEQVANGLCERCDSEAIQKKLKQWFFKITNFSDQLISDLDEVDWPEKVKKMQVNWIGKSKGARIKFKVSNVDQVIEVFTTRPDTLFGATYLALAPESSLIDKLISDKQRPKVNQYLKEVSNLSIRERKTKEDKTGIFTGAYAINPVNNKKIPIWIADYVLEAYGTGAIMAVPAHDQRDFEFASKYNIDIIEVISPDGKQHRLKKAYEGEGKLINSSQFDGKTSKGARQSITKYLAEKETAEFEINYRLNDWLISRQRYWGTPIPIIHCQKCGTVPVPKDELPVRLPKLDDFKPAAGGKSPLAKVDEFVNVKCPQCKGDAKRETDTMDTFVDSSWYYLRYPNPAIKEAPFDSERLDKWLPVDKYIGGVEHAVLHLLYARFITKALHKMGHINFYEPFKSLYNQGMIYRHGKKMSKSVGNVISPDDLVDKYGRDALRGYELFIGPPEQDKEWNDKGIEGVYRFLAKTYKMFDNKKMVEAEVELDKIKDQKIIINDLIKDVNSDLKRFHLNTIVSSLMKAVNKLSKKEILDLQTAEKLIILMAPIFPHLAEELWQMTDKKTSVFDQKWPNFKNIKKKRAHYEVVVQVNGKKRGSYKAKPDQSCKEIIDNIIKIDSVAEAIGSKDVTKEIVVPRKDKTTLPPKLINFVTS
jgi:leucyl-tRNA synthetase